MRTILLSLALLLACALPTQAQNYAQLSKQAQRAANQDLPRDACRALSKLARLAEAEDCDPWRLRAALMLVSVRQEISPDSLATDIAALRERAEAQTDPVRRAVWHAALAQLVSQRRWELRRTHHEVDDSLLQRYVETALADLELLRRTPARDYAPLFNLPEPQTDLYGGDLLSLVLRQAAGLLPQGRLDTLQAQAATLYRRDALPRAALALELQRAGRLQNDTERTERLEALRREFLPLKENADTYLALIQACTRDSARQNALAREALERYGRGQATAQVQNFLAEQEQPSLEVRLAERVLYPGHRYTVHLRSRHVGHAQWRLRRLCATARHEAVALGPAGKLTSLLESRSARRATLLELTLPQGAEPGARPAWQWRDDSLTLTAPEAGVYLCELLIDGRVEDRSVVYCSRLRPLITRLPDGRTRVVALDGETGKPLGGQTERAKVAGARPVSTGGRTTFVTTRTHTADSTACVFLKPESGCRYFLFTPSDAFLPQISLLPGSEWDGIHPRQARLCIYTDRAIYRPGQTVQFALLAYRQQADQTEVAGQAELQVSLTDARGKEVSRQTLRTDSLGTASGTFALPADCLPGLLRLSAAGGALRGDVSLSVEEYKRPTLLVETYPIKETYAPGDTALVCGQVRTYAGVAVAGAEVRFSVELAQWLGWGTSDDARPAEEYGTVLTDAQGRFRVPVRLAPTHGSQQAAREASTRAASTRYFYRVSLAATAPGGETAEASTSVCCATHRVFASVEAEATLCRERPTPLRLNLTNSAGEPLQQASGTLLVRQGGQERLRLPFAGPGALRAEALSQLLALPSGRYTLSIELSGLPAEQVAREERHVTLFSLADTRPACREEPCFFHELSDSLDGPTRGVVTGTPEQDVTLFVDVLWGGRLQRSERYTLSDTLRLVPTPYEPEMGDGVTYSFAFVRHGRLFAHQVSVARPLPEKRLLLSWHTFRNRLSPGSHERWTLSVCHPDGRPAAAGVMVRLYDASLDALRDAPWQFGLHFARNLSLPYCSTLSPSQLWQLGQADFKYLRQANGGETPWWLPSLFSYRRLGGRGTGARHTDVKVYASMAPRVLARSLSNDALVQDAKAADGGGDLMDRATGSRLPNQAERMATPPSGTLPVRRENFAETACFLPALRTDAEGRAVIEFDLPESLTQWNLTALAHTAQVDYGLLTATAVASRDFMLQPALPRFLREGDHAVLPATVSNLSERRLTGRATLLLRSATDTAQVAHRAEQRFSVEPGQQTTLRFALDVPEGHTALECVMTATAEGCSDGETHLLPVLADRVQVVRSLPFALTQAGERSFRVDTLLTHAGQARSLRLAVDTQEHPAWQAVRALGGLAGADCLTATSWAERLYALVLARHTCQEHPEIARALQSEAKELYTSSDTSNDPWNVHLAPHVQTLLSETPWALAAERDAQRTQGLVELLDDVRYQARTQQALDHLADMQLASGAWPWCPGMGASAYVTAEVCTQLARLEQLAHWSRGSQLLRRALPYLEAGLKEEAERLQRLQRTHTALPSPSEAMLRYLYVRALLGLERTQAADCLLSLAQAQQLDLTMLGKARLTTALQGAGQAGAAQTFARSLLQHTLTDPTRPELGRYFDTDRAQSLHCTYRLSTQAAAIEALEDVQLPPAQADAELPPAQAAEEMRLWLLQHKRTAEWPTGQTTADAVSALLRGAGASALLDTAQTLEWQLTDRRGRTLAQSTPPPKHGGPVETDRAPATLVCRTTQHTPVWGSLTAEYTLPSRLVTASGDELRLEQHLERQLPDGTWKPLPGGQAVRVGERVRQVVLITARRDFDFTCLSLPRPGCTEPAEALSSYGWHDGLATYRAVRDASCQFYIERLPKGRHQLTETLRTDRPGRYTLSPATLTCLYAPEFRATAPALTLSVQP